MRKLLIVALLALCCAVPASAQTPANESVVQAAIGANGIWYKDDARPSDFEIGANARASLSPHISAVASSYYGFVNSYVRGAIGARVTATDIEDPYFSIGLGLQYHLSSEPAIHAQEWAPDVSVGWVPWKARLPLVSLVGQAYYGMTTNQAYVVAGVRYSLGGLK
jgi:hypothetical protein